MVAATAPEDLYLAAGVVGLALVAFIAVLYLNRKASKASGGAGGTILTHEDGRLVRRSTRQAKPVAKREEDTPSKEPRTPRTAGKSPARTPRTAEPTPARGRKATKSPAPRRTAAKSPAPPKSPAASPAPKSTVRRSTRVARTAA